MPELPDVTVYVEALRERVVGARLEGIRLANPFVLRSVDPPLGDVVGRTVTGVRRLGKRIVLALEAERFVVVHLMIAGRLHWKAAGARPPGRIGVAAFDFTTGTLVMTEAGTKKRAAIHLVRGEAALAEHDRGGLEPLTAGLEEFRAALRAESHTLKRALTDPIERLRRAAGGDFPEGVTAFRPDMAVHGRFRQPCPDCGAPVQRIVYAENETNYCPRCQTGDRLLADRGLSRLLKQDWPRTLDELERHVAARRGGDRP